MVWETVLWALITFLSRVLDVGLGTLRVQLIVRRRKYMAAMIGFVEILIYILIVSRVITDLSEWKGWISLIPLIAYAGGFAVGTLAGIVLSEKMGRGSVEVTIITQEPREQMEAAVRQAGFALTRYQGVGREGPVEVFSVVCSSRDMPRLLQTVTHVDPKSFVYTQELTGLRGGYVYGVKSKL